MDFNRVEKKWQGRWEKAKIFQVREGKKKKLYILEMLPYPSAAGLHMGHIRNYSIGDSFARFKRMQGFNVLYPMGYDAFGLPAENAAIKNRTHPKTYTERAMAGIRKNQKALGLSYDWTREIATCYPEYYRWNQWIFLKMLKKGLAYKKKAPVNWCPKCNTVLANEQVESGRCWRCESQVEIRNLEQWFFRITKYADRLLKGLDRIDWPDNVKKMQTNWIGRKEGYTQFYKVNGMDITLSTFTTHHHTSFAEIFMAIAPEHPLATKLVKGTKYEKGAKKFIDNVMKKKVGGKFTPESAKDGYFTGRYAKDPFSKRDLPIYIADFALMEFGTGIVKASAHDQRDFDFAKTHGIELVEVLFPNKLVEKSRNDPKTEYDIIHPGLDNTKMHDYSYDGPYNEKKIGSASVEISGKEAVIRLSIEKTAPHKDLQEASAIHQLEYSLFQKKGIEKILVIFENFSCTMEDMENIGFIWSNGKFELQRGQGKVSFSYDGQGYMFRSDQFTGMSVPEARKKISEWMVKKGYGEKSVTYSLRDWLISRQRYWGTPIPIIYCKKCGTMPVPEKDLPVLLPTNVKLTGHGNPLAKLKSFTDTRCPKCRGKAKRETDTMDTFMDSNWYFLRYCSPKSKQMFDTKAVKYWMPVDYYIGGVEHAVMHLLYARFFIKVLKDFKLLDFDEPFLRLFNQGIVYKDGHKMSKSFGNVVTQEEIAKKYGTDTARLFLLFVSSPESQLEWSDKGIVGLYRFLMKLLTLAKGSRKARSSGKANSRDRLIESRLHSLIKQVTEYMDGFRFNKAIGAIMGFVNELQKYQKSGPNRGVFLDALKNTAVILSPFAPHLMEECWEILGGKGLVSTQPWPKYDSKKIDKKAEALEALASEIREDISEILRLARISKPRKIAIYISAKWKYNLFRALKVQLGKTRDQGAIMKSIMANKDLRQHGKEISRLVPQALKSPERVPQAVLDQESEFRRLSEESESLSRKFSCQVEILKAEGQKSEKAGKAEPSKPGIEVS